MSKRLTQTKLLNMLKDAKGEHIAFFRGMADGELQLMFGTNGENAVIDLLKAPDSSWETKMCCIMTLGQTRVLGDGATDDIQAILEDMARNAPPMIASFGFTLAMSKHGATLETAALYKEYANGEAWQVLALNQTLEAVKRAMQTQRMLKAILANPDRRPDEILRFVGNHS